MSAIGEQVEALLRQGLTQAEIARRLRVAASTVEYHVERARRRKQLRPKPRVRTSGARTEVRTREAVARLLDRGIARAEIARKLGISKATVSYHARRLGRGVDRRCARRYHWKSVQEFYDLGHSKRDCMAEFGFSSQTWHAAVRRGAILARPAKMPTEQFFAAGVHRNRTYLKTRLIAEGFKDACCEACGISEWRGKPMSLALHHINGERDDNRIENLELLCPNCHSQTSTFAGRNGHRRRGASIQGRR